MQPASRLQNAAGGPGCRGNKRAALPLLPVGRPGALTRRQNRNHQQKKGKDPMRTLWLTCLIFGLTTSALQGACFTFTAVKRVDDEPDRFRPDSVLTVTVVPGSPDNEWPIGETRRAVWRCS